MDGVTTFTAECVGGPACGATRTWGGRTFRVLMLDGEAVREEHYRYHIPPVGGPQWRFADAPEPAEGTDE